MSSNGILAHRAQLVDQPQGPLCKVQQWLVEKKKP
jgi:hypothetical protein